MRLGDFVLSNLPPAPARVLEVGCGRGELALRVEAAGHDVVAIDPDAPSGPPFLRVTLEQLENQDPFDAVIASRSLHHIHDLDGALDRIHALLRPSGTVVVNEHAYELMDEATAEWYFERRREHAHGGGAHPAPPSLEACTEEWHGHHAELHRSDTMLAALDQHFERRQLEWGPYLFEELGPATSADEERSLIEAGRIRATGFRYVGELRAR